MSIDWKSIDWGLIHQLTLDLTLLLIVIYVGIGMVRSSRDEKSRLNLEDLLIDDVTGKTSKVAFVFIGTWMVATWAVVYMITNGKMEPHYWDAYLAVFATPAVAKIVWGKRYKDSSNKP